MKVCWAWLQGAKRGLPEIPAEFILASKLKHAKALQKDLPEIPSDRLEDYRHEFKVLWRGISSERFRHVTDEDGIRCCGVYRQWKADKPLRRWQGNPGWNACIESSRGQGGKTEAVRNAIHDRIAKSLEAYVNSDPERRSEYILPEVPMEQVASWAVEGIRDRPLQA